MNILVTTLTAATLSNFNIAKPTGIKVIDGDTIQLSLPDLPDVFGKNISVRINGIDAPEMKDKRVCGKRDANEAKAILTDLIGSNKVDLRFCQRDKYFRLLCSIDVDGIDAAEYMISSGYVNLYAGKTKLKWKCK